MKKIFLVFVFLVTIMGLKAQDAATVLAGRIAQKMKDSLSLSDAQKTKLYDINILLHRQKTNMRQLYAGSDSMGYYIQKTENKRDSLYRSVLSDDKYRLYKEKKATLVSSN